MPLLLQVLPLCGFNILFIALYIEFEAHVHMVHVQKKELGVVKPNCLEMQW